MEEKSTDDGEFKKDLLTHVLAYIITIFSKLAFEIRCQVLYREDARECQAR